MTCEIVIFQFILIVQFVNLSTYLTHMATTKLNVVRECIINVIFWRVTMCVEVYINGWWRIRFKKKKNCRENGSIIIQLIK